MKEWNKEQHIKGIWLKWQKLPKRLGQKEVKITSRNFDKTKTRCHDSSFYDTIIQMVSWTGHSQMLDILIICKILCAHTIHV